MPYKTHLRKWWCAIVRHPFLYTLFCLNLAMAPTVSLAQQVPLTLSQAVSRVLANNPELQVFDLRLQALQGRRLTADQAPAYEASMEVENLFGNGSLQRTDQADFTPSLSSVIELGDKRQARTNLVVTQLQMVEAERRADSLNLLGQVTQQFIATLALQEKLELAADTVGLAENTYSIVSNRANQGAASDAEMLRAKAAVSQARIDQARLVAEYDSQKMLLAGLWGETQINFSSLAGNLFQSGVTESFEVLYQQVRENPLIQVYASEGRVREAELQLARSQSKSDVRWQLGVRRSGESGETALLAGISMPLFAGQRNRGEVQAALAARDAVEFRRRGALLRLHSSLFEAYQVRQHNISAVSQLQSEILPDLTTALRLTQEAYENGRYSYVEWVAAQVELLSARRTLIDAATTALLNQTFIEQLTAQSLFSSVNREESEPSGFMQ